MRALILIDLQIDFCPGGALEVKEGDQLIPIANKLMDHFELVLASKDWHPGNHGSFAANHPWRYPGQVIELNGLQQTLWPIHCVQESFGSEFAMGLQYEKINKIFYKGTDPGIDSYSCFFDNGHRRSTGMAEYLKEKGVTELFIMGLATDYCVKFSVLDALQEGFSTKLIIDGCRGIDLEKGDVEKAIQEMQQKGADLVSSDNILKETD